jgi:hypothetical protein
MDRLVIPNVDKKWCYSGADQLGQNDITWGNASNTVLELIVLQNCYVAKLQSGHKTFLIFISVVHILDSRELEKLHDLHW